MGSWYSTPQVNDQFTSTLTGQTSPDRPLRQSSPPHPSKSNFIKDTIPARPRPRPRTALSYFLPNPTPELQHSHSEPTLKNIHQTTKILLTKLPPELVSRILDEGRYWAGNRVLLKKELDVAAALPHFTTIPRESGWRNGQEDGVDLKDGAGEAWYLLSEAVGSESIQETGSSSSTTEGGNSRLGTGSLDLSDKGGESEEEEEEAEEGCWLREIVIETLSKDQGWSSAVTANPALYGTYDSTYSWFEISILRDGVEVDGTRRSIQNNVHAGQYFKAHRIVLGSEDEFVRKVRKGDRVVLWVRAQYPGWTNTVREAAITLYCAPFPLT